MNLATAKGIIEALAEGIDLRTREVLPPGSPIDSVAVLLALRVALDSMREERREHRRARSRPRNSRNRSTLQTT